jgi:hypothetical protein
LSSITDSDGADGSSTDPIGGNGPQLLTLAANEADIVGLTGITFRQNGAHLPGASHTRGVRKA